MRAHYRGSVRDSSGNLLAGTAVTVWDNGTMTLVAVPIYSDGTSGATLANPFITSDGNISFYLDVPARVDLQVEPNGQNPVTIPDVDVIIPVAS